MGTIYFLCMNVVIKSKIRYVHLLVSYGTPQPPQWWDAESTKGKVFGVATKYSDSPTQK